MQNKTLQRNFQGYTTDTVNTLIGMGISSISSLPQGYVQNTSSNKEYSQRVQSGKLPIFRGYTLSSGDKERREIIMSLMCYLSTRVDPLKYSDEINRLKPYRESGDVFYQDEILTISPKARKRLRIITSVFDAYLSSTAHLYSKAI